MSVTDMLATVSGCGLRGCGSAAAGTCEAPHTDASWQQHDSQLNGRPSRCQVALRQASQSWAGVAGSRSTCPLLSARTRGKRRELGMRFQLAGRAAPGGTGSRRRGPAWRAAGAAGEGADSSAVAVSPAQSEQLGKGDENLHKRLEATMAAAVAEEVELSERAAEQFMMDHIQKGTWQRRLLRAAGRLRGSPWDPLPGGDVPFAKFWELVDREQVRYMEYGDYGKDVSVILPHSVEMERAAARGDASVAAGESEGATSAVGPLGSLGAQNEGTEVAPVKDPALMKVGEEVLWRRHKVAQMPANAHTELWARLPSALVDVRMTYPSSVAAEVRPTLGVAAVWGTRLALAVLLFQLLDRWLLPVYRPTRLENRPSPPRRKFRAALNTGLGLLGKSRARFISAEERTGVTFDDFAGQENIKRDVKEIVRILKEPGEFEAMGVYCPKGVLLHGPPGTGKTLLARAIAGEAGLPFFSASGAEFVEMFAGVAAARVRDLFSRARQFAPSIIFIDEIDAIGAARGSGVPDGGSVEREQGLIQILTELDGFQTTSAKVLVVGATNRLDMLDPALTRKGRFDRIIAVGLPNERGRFAILQVHARNKLWRSEEEKLELLKEVANLTPDFSGAELQNILNEASILAVREDKDFIERPELLEAIERQSGRFKTGQEDMLDASGEARLQMAYREAAIAVLHCSLPDPGRQMRSTTAARRSPAPNMAFARPRHRTFARKPDVVASIVRALAPAVVEELVFGADNRTWASGPSIGQAAAMADYLILRTGFTALGKVYYQVERDLVPHLGPKVQALRDAYIRYARRQCEQILAERQPAMEGIAQALIDKEEVTADEIWSIYKAAPTNPQPDAVPEVDEYYAIMAAGRWGVHGLSLPGRVTFTPGNLGYATFGAPRPHHVKMIDNRLWKAMDERAERRVQEKRRQARVEEEGGAGEEEPGDVLVGASFL